MASEPTPQQLITQSAQATADAIGSALTAKTASISLLAYDWDSKDAYHSFSIFWHTLENWLLLNCIPLDSEDHLRYVFAALGTKSLEVHAQWMPTGSKKEQKATKVKASAFLDQIQQGMTHNVNTMYALEKLRMLWPGQERNPKILSHTSRLMDCCEMINDEHHEHKLCCHIICAYHHEEKLLGKLMAKPFKTPSSELADIAVNHFAIQHAQEQVSRSSKPVDTICQDKWHTPDTIAMVTHHLHPPRTAPTAHSNTQLAEQTALHMIPIAPNATRWDIGDQNAMVASHSNQGMHLHLSHSRGSPDAHLWTTITAVGGVTKQMP